MPGTPPQGWQAPKTSYDAEDVLTPEQFERIEGNAYATELGARTIDPSQSPTGVIGTLRQLLDWFANRIKAIVGETNWHDSPPTTLKAAKTHIDAAAPHSGHETPLGAQAKVDAHAALTGVDAHGGSTAATGNTIAVRDSGGRLKAAAPVASDDVARKADIAAGPTPGNLCIAASNAEVVTSSKSTMVKLKEIRVYFSGSVRVKFDMYGNTCALGAPRGEIYVNGVATGKYEIAGASWKTYSVDMSVQPGDYVQLYGNAGHCDSMQAKYRNFQVLVTEFPMVQVIT